MLTSFSNNHTHGKTTQKNEDRLKEKMTTNDKQCDAAEGWGGIRSLSVIEIFMTDHQQGGTHYKILSLGGACDECEVPNHSMSLNIVTQL